jgi:predicted O-linked N-acetylglucosamine transferase (SPINDLY family)
MRPGAPAQPTLLDSAQSALKAGQLERARDLCEAFLQGAPKHPDALLLRGILHHRAGEPQEAERAIERAVAARPNFAYAHFVLGLNRLESARPGAAVTAFRRALDIDANFAPAWATLAAALLGVGRPADALDACARAIGLMPNLPAPLWIRADALADLHRLDEAVSCARQATARAPDDPRSWRTLTNVLEHCADLPAALEAVERWRALEPGSAVADAALGRLYSMTGQYDDALAILEAAVARAPDNAEVHATLGLVKTFWRGSLGSAGGSPRGRYDEAVVHFERARALSPEDPAVLTNLGNALQVLGRSEEAIGHYERVIAVSPDHLVALNNLGAARSTLGDIGGALSCFERALAIVPTYELALNNLGAALLALGRTDVAIERFQAVADRSGNPDVFSNLLYAQHYLPDVTPTELLERHRRYDGYVAVKPPARHRNAPDPDRPLRIGYVSGDFAVHPVGHFVASVITRHDKSQFAAYCYSGRPSEDEIGERIKRHADEFRRTIAMTDEALIERIRDDSIDVLIDLSGHTAANRLVAFAHKPAPVQATWAGYIGTTGLQAIDWLIADRFHVPPQLEGFHSERVYRMPNDYICYEPYANAPPVGPLPALRNGHVTFCSFANPAKINAGTIAVWARTLAAVPASRLRLRYRGMDAALNVKRLHDGFAAHGIAPERLVIQGGGDIRAMLDSYNESDIGLDTFPYSGGLTTCEALWMGVPVVTWPGERFESRHSLSHLSNAGLAETAARDLDDYVAIAVKLAGDLPALADLRLNLRPRMAASPLCDADRFVRDLEAALRAMWRDWCARSGERPADAVDQPSGAARKLH